jgi:hypothetical protein
VRPPPSGDQLARAVAEPRRVLLERVGRYERPGTERRHRSARRPSFATIVTTLDAVVAGFVEDVVPVTAAAHLYPRTKPLVLAGLENLVGVGTMSIDAWQPLTAALATLPREVGVLVAAVPRLGRTGRRDLTAAVRKLTEPPGGGRSLDSPSGSSLDEELERSPRRDPRRRWLRATRGARPFTGLDGGRTGGVAYALLRSHAPKRARSCGFSWANARRLSSCTASISAHIAATSARSSVLSCWSCTVRRPKRDCVAA